MVPAIPPDDDHLDREGARFVRYLTAQAPTAYVVAKYLEAHAHSEALRRDGRCRFERLLLAVAGAHALGARLVDAYTAIFLKTALVRRKWVLLLAILETCAPTAEYFDEPHDTGRAAVLARLGWQGAMFALTLLLSVLVFTPLRFALGWSADPLEGA